MSNAGLPEKPPKTSTPPPEDDIPEAVRDIPTNVRQYSLKPGLLIGGLVGLGAIAFSVGILVSLVSRSSVPSPTPSPTQAVNTPSPVAEDTLLGHFSYQEAPRSELAPITQDGRIRMRKAAAQQYRAMVADARRAGVIIVPISGFRSIADQKHLFFDVKAQRGQVTTKRAEVSAPPGYSEHHTGYAVDLGDANVPATNLNPRFESTAAFKWLKANAARYSFEISFPRDNPQGVIYEPWHWRYVGDQDSLETFYKARNQ